MSSKNVARAKAMTGSPMVRASVACKGKKGKSFRTCHRKWEKVFEREHRRPHRRRRRGLHGFGRHLRRRRLRTQRRMWSAPW